MVFYVEKKINAPRTESLCSLVTVMSWLSCLTVSSEISHKVKVR
ncbi:hypothetical protein ANH9381_0897 [Aggregatibacter actinomycetemcomitans ANH9381]|nr:hypothetical protein ANH9381_0897 [Aggregatibacter actinomycetemcomitans ANH9381]